jgi:DNA-binding GntR family transcriptional regulator
LAAHDDAGGVVRDAEDVAHAVRQRIQNSELAPGEWLREARLCGEFGVGRSIVRRALRILAEDGLIEIAENRGARVLATSVEEVFDLYEVRAALYGLAARFACLRGSDAQVREMLRDIDQLFADTAAEKPAEALIALSEVIFTKMAACASADTQRMIEGVRRKTRFHFSYAALALTGSPGPSEPWLRVRAALEARDANGASQGARDILYFMQGEVAKIMLSHGPRVRETKGTLAIPTAAPKRRAAAKKGAL